MSPPAAGPLLSKRSNRVRAARRLTRRASRTELGLFLAEGPQAVREALAAPGVVREVLKHKGVETAVQCDIDEQVTHDDFDALAAAGDQAAARGGLALLRSHPELLGLLTLRTYPREILETWKDARRYSATVLAVRRPSCRSTSTRYRPGTTANRYRP